MDGGCNDRLLLVNVSLFTRIAECKLSITDADHCTYQCEVRIRREDRFSGCSDCLNYTQLIIILITILLVRM